MKKLLFLLAGSVCFLLNAQSDSASTKSKKHSFLYKTFHKETYGKNTIRYNPMASMLFADSRNTALGYERITWKGQSASVNFGMFYFPNIAARDIGAVNATPQKNQGFILSLDYRFYLQHLNARPAPNGVYIGPYYSIYKNHGGVNFTYSDQSINYNAELTQEFAFHNVGFQLGYQFIFAKRFTLDLVLFGPSVSFYKVKLDMESNLSDEKKRAIYEKYYDSFFSKYPIFDELTRFGDFERQKVSSGMIPNFRYTIQFGYHF